MSTPLQVVVVDSEQAFYGLEPIWNDLLESSGSRSLFLRWEWIETWWAVYGSDYRLLVLLAHDKGRPGGARGIAFGELR